MNQFRTIRRRHVRVTDLEHVEDPEFVVDLLPDLIHAVSGEGHVRLAEVTAGAGHVLFVLQARRSGGVGLVVPLVLYI